MRRFAILITLFLLIIPTLTAHASREGLLVSEEFQHSSSGIAGSGPVHIYGRQSESRVTALSVQAFGKTIELSKEDLAELQGGINGVQVSYETGRRESGGRTIYVLLSKGFTSGLRSTQLVSINEQGKIEVGKVQKK